MKDKPWRPYHILKGDDLMSGPITFPSKYVNYTFAYDPSLVPYLRKALKAHPYSPNKEPFGIEYWLTKPPSFIGRLKKFLGRLNPIPKEKRPMTKKKLIARIKNLEGTIEYQENEIKRWEESCDNLVKKYVDLQQAVCDFAEKAGITETEKSVFVPKSVTW